MLATVSFSPFVCEVTGHVILDHEGIFQEEGQRNFNSVLKPLYQQF